MRVVSRAVALLLTPAEPQGSIFQFTVPSSVIR
jgi:hypothetical protein